MERVLLCIHISLDFYEVNLSNAFTFILLPCLFVEKLMMMMKIPPEN